MFWLIIVPILALIIIFAVAKFFIDHSEQKKVDKDDRDIYRSTIYRDDD